MQPKVRHRSYVIGFERIGGKIEVVMLRIRCMGRFPGSPCRTGGPEATLHFWLREVRKVPSHGWVMCALTTYRHSLFAQPHVQASGLVRPVREVRWLRARVAASLGPKVRDSNACNPRPSVNSSPALVLLEGARTTGARRISRAWCAPSCQRRSWRGWTGGASIQSLKLYTAWRSISLTTRSPLSWTSWTLGRRGATRGPWSRSIR
jgi:hypothetical protein